MIYRSWEGESIACQVSQLQPQKACSFVNADVSVTLNTTSIQTPPSHSTFHLSPDTPTLDLECNAGFQFMIEITKAPSSHLVVKGPNLCCIAYLNFSEDEEAYNEKVSPSPTCHKQSFFVDQERTVLQINSFNIDLN